MSNYGLATVGIAPVRGMLICHDFEDRLSHNINTGLPRTMEFFFNPDSIDFTTEAEWARTDVPGLSHQVLQYSHTLSNEISFDLEWNAIEARRRQRKPSQLRNQAVNYGLRNEAINYGLLYKDWLYALTLPLGPGLAPSRVTLVWPDVMQVRGVVESVSFNFTKFGQTGGVIAFSAAIDMVELRTVFLARRGIMKYFDRAPVDPPPYQEAAREQEKVIKRAKKKATKESAVVNPSGENITYASEFENVYNLGGDEENMTYAEFENVYSGVR
jgi:hypothetical protein